MQPAIVVGDGDGADRVTKTRLFFDCLTLGLTAWGGFMALLAQAQERFVKQRKWMSEKEFLDLIALATMLPGPQAVNALAVMGHRVAGWGGFAAALAGIVLPGFFIILTLWFGYAFLSGYPGLLRALTVGVLPPLAMILGQAALNQSKKAAPERSHKVLAVTAAVLLVVTPFWAAPIAVLMFGALVSLLFWPAPKQVERAPARRMRPLELVLCIAPAGLAVFQLVPDLLPQALVAKVGLAFAGMSTTLFGGGLVMVPLLEGLIVDHLGWLNHAGFSAGLAASQLTPGPILGIATFTGMEVAGFAGALAATFGIYGPTALIAVGVSSVADRLKGSRRFQHAMMGVRCAVVGLIAGAAVSLLLKMPLKAAPWQCGVMVAAAYLVVWRLKQPPYIALPIGMLLAWLLQQAPG
jgi:chromate transporter